MTPNPNRVLRSHPHPSPTCMKSKIKNSLHQWPLMIFSVFDWGHSWHAYITGGLWYVSISTENNTLEKAACTGLVSRSEGTGGQPYHLPPWPSCPNPSLSTHWLVPFSLVASSSRKAPKFWIWQLGAPAKHLHLFFFFIKSCHRLSI